VAAVSRRHDEVIFRLECGDYEGDERWLPRRTEEEEEEEEEDQYEQWLAGNVW